MTPTEIDILQRLLDVSLMLANSVCGELCSSHMEGEPDAECPLSNKVFGDAQAILDINAMIVDPWCVERQSRRQPVD